jgi:hypothetical protein
MDKVIIIGNGFSIDFIKKNSLDNQIDVQNLFRFGSRVHWPQNNKPGFLSNRYCKNLSILGAKPTLSSEESLSLIENIVTCSNVLRFSINKTKNIKELESSSKIYIDAYIEFTYYLRYLMAYYNSLIEDDMINEASKTNEMINYIKDSYNKGDNISIISFNYDIILERMLKVLGLSFHYAGFETKDNSIKIFKPHGSINFVHNKKYEYKNSFIIPDGAEFFGEEFNAKSTDFTIVDVNEDFCDVYPIYSNLVPPAGDANRIASGWSKDMQDELNKVLDNFPEDSETVIFGMSYWQVDRSEIDSILTNINRKTAMYYINPSPSENLDNVLMCLFSEYIQSPDMSVLGG